MATCLYVRDDTPTIGIGIAITAITSASNIATTVLLLPPLLVVILLLLFVQLICCATLPFEIKIRRAGDRQVKVVGEGREDRGLP